MYNEIIEDRIEAGLLLSEKLKKYQKSNTVILAVPRGGVPVGYTIAKTLQLPFDIVLSKKIGHPHNQEFAIGAVSADSILINEYPEVPKHYIEDEIARLRKAIDEKYKLYMGNRKPLEIKNKNVVIVDDGIATGNTLLACIIMLRKKNPAKIIVAVPVLPTDVLLIFKQNTDELVYLIAAKNFRAVGEFYKSFEQIQDIDVIRMLNTESPIE